MKFRIFATGLTLGALLAVGALRLFPHVKKTVQATVGDVTINQSVGGTATLGTVNFQKIQDTANTSYFLDPAATGDSLILAGKVTTTGITAGSGAFLPMDSYAGIKVGPDITNGGFGNVTILDLSNTTGGAAFSALVIVTGRRADNGNNVFTDILIFQMENYVGYPATGTNSKVVVLGSSEYTDAYSTTRSYSTSGYSLIGNFSAGGAGVYARAVAYLGNGSIY